MANQRNAAVEEKIKNAEKIIQSYAYDENLDQAIDYLKANDPENAVLANIKDFENNRPMLKVLNALYRADEARAKNDTAELRKIAEFLDNYKAYDEKERMQAEAKKILKELPEVSSEEAEAVSSLIDETEKLNRVKEKQNYVKDNTPSMSDDEIVANSNKVLEIFDNQFKWKDIIGEGDNVTIVGADGEALPDEEQKKIKGLHRKWVELDTVRAHSDDAAFAAMDDKEKADTLKEDVYTRFWSDIEAMTATTADLDGADVEEARAKARRHQPVNIRADVYDSNRQEKIDRINDKVGQFSRQKKEKAKSWLSDKLDKLNKFTRKITGYTPVEFGKAIFSVFSKRRVAANIGTSIGTLGLSGWGATSAAATIAGGAGVAAAMPAIAVAAAGIAVYSLYSAYSQQRWSIWEKKHAYWKAAKEKGDAKEIARWSGMAGWNNALKAIKANPEENKVYEYTKKTNKRYGLLSGALMGAATALVPGSSAIGRMVGGTTRAVGANQNAGFLYKLAKEKYEQDQTEQNETNVTRARTGLILGLLGTTATEIALALNVSASDIGAENNPSHVNSLMQGQQNDGIPTENTGGSQLTGTPWGKYSQERIGDGNDASATAEVASASTTPIDWHEGISASQARWIETHVQGQAAEYAKIFGWNVNPENMEEVAQKMAGNIKNAIDNGALPDKPVGEIMYKYLHLIAWREKGEYVSGGLIQSTMVNGEPDYWTNAEEIKAMNHIIFCNEKVNVSSDALGHTLDRITASGDDLDKSLDHLTTNRYVGTADLMHKDGDVDCAHVSYWERGKRIIRGIFKPAEEQQTPPPPPPADAEVNDPVAITNKEPADTPVDDNATIKAKAAEDYHVDDGGKVGTYSRIVGGTTKNTVGADSFGSEDVGPKKLVPGSVFNLGKQVKEMD